MQSLLIQIKSDSKYLFLTLVLKDYKSWKIYAKKYTKEDLEKSKEIHYLAELEDIYFAIADNY